MGNVVTKNGVASSSLTGLLISELPDISHAPQRVEVTQIDGLDGDVVRNQGYDSYKKQLQIGLYGSYDIDAIMHFFTGSGEFVFSNEPTKKYVGRIEDSIDFTRLVRFRTGTVDIVVQPYKKLVTEADATGTTSPLTVTNQGYENSLPKLVLTAAAGEVITLALGGLGVVTVTMPPEGTITLDSETLNCYNSNADKNQYVSGEFMVLPSGASDISWTGALDSLTVSPRSRWL